MLDGLPALFHEILDATAEFTASESMDGFIVGPYASLGVIRALAVNPVQNYTNTAGSCDTEYNGHPTGPGLFAASSALDANSQALPPLGWEQYEISREDLDQSIGWWQTFTPAISAGAALSHAEELVTHQANTASDTRSPCETLPPASIWHDERHDHTPVTPISSDLSPHQRSPASKTGGRTTGRYFNVVPSPPPLI